MKQLVCEMCGSTDLVKQDGVFVCQTCGCKYSVEEARRMMVEGTVKVDETDKAENWYKMAEAAFENSNWDEAYSYYCKVLEVRSVDWVSTYKKGFCLGWKSNLANIKANEVLGGIVDGRKQLLESSHIEDVYKANGITMMAMQLHNWIAAVNNLSIEHANEYCDTLVSACNEFFDRTALISKLMVFQLGLFDEFVVMNVDDINQTETLLNTTISLARNINSSLNATFRPKTGTKWDSFWETYDDVYETVNPTYTARNAASELNSAINTIKTNFTKWKATRLEAEKQARIKQYLEEHPDTLQKLKEKEEQQRSAKISLDKAQRELTEAENKKKPTADTYASIEKEISENNLTIAKLKKKIFGKQKAAEEAGRLEAVNAQNQSKLSALKPTLDVLDDVVKTAQTVVNQCQMAYDNITKDIDAIKKAAGC